MTEPSAQTSQHAHAPATVAELMQPAVTTAEQDGHLAAAAYLMRHAGATALVVLDTEDDKRPVGVITEADIVRAVADGKDMNDVRIRDAMTRDPTAISATTSVRDAAESMVAGHFRHLPVVEDGALIGMVDVKDVCRALLELSV